MTAERQKARRFRSQLWRLWSKQDGNISCCPLAGTDISTCGTFWIIYWKETDQLSKGLILYCTEDTNNLSFNTVHTASFTIYLCKLLLFQQGVLISVECWEWRLSHHFRCHQYLSPNYCAGLLLENSSLPPQWVSFHPGYGKHRRGGRPSGQEIRIALFSNSPPARSA